MPDPLTHRPPRPLTALLADLRHRHRPLEPDGLGMMLWMLGDGRTFTAPLGTPYPFIDLQGELHMSPAWSEVEVNP